MSRYKGILMLILAALVIFLGSIWLFPSEEERILKTLGKLENLVSFSPDDSVISHAAEISSLRGFLTTNIVVEWRGAERRPGHWRGRAEVLEAAKGVRARLDALDVKLLDPMVELQGEDRALVKVIARVRTSEWEEEVYQSFEVTLHKEQGEWNVAKVIPVEMLSQEYLNRPPGEPRSLP